MNLTIDIGNTAVKAALFEKGRPVRVVERDEWRKGGFEKAILVSTRGDVDEIEAEVRGLAGYYLRFGPGTPTPLRNLYATPETLGPDRLAAAVGAHAMHPDRTMLVVDFGTAITFDVVTAAGEYLGGNISPGAGARFRALHDYTDALPMCELPVSPADFPARDTKTAISEGVATGITAEVEHCIGAVRQKFPGAGTIFTGGDADYFAGRVKFPIFAVSDLVFKGLNAILEHNANL